MCPHKVALAASQIVADDTRELLLSSQKCVVPEKGAQRVAIQK